MTIQLHDLKLHDLAGQDDDCRFSPHCWRVRMALAHKGLEVETLPWRFTEKDAIADSGQGQVPVLRDGDRVVHESWQIAEYLDEAYPERPRLFESPQARAHAQMIRHWAQRSLHPAVVQVIMPELFAALHEKDKGYFRESREARFGTTLEAFAGDREEKLANLGKALAPLRDTVKLQPYLGGTAPSFADYIVFGAFQWARAVCPTALVAEDDPVYAWRGRLLEAYDGLAAKAQGFPV